MRDGAASELSELREENAYLKETIRQMRASMAPETLVLPAGCQRLTPAERRLLAALVERDVVTREYAQHVLYADKPEADFPGTDVVGVFICRLRRKIAAAGATIAGIYGVGWQMSGKDAFRQGESR